jgi:hypothetical protein
MTFFSSNRMSAPRPCPVKPIAIRHFRPGKDYVILQLNHLGSVPNGILSC